MWTLLFALSLASIALTRAAPHSSQKGELQARWPDDPSYDVPEGFVTTKGSQFWHNHSSFYFAGANSYWIAQLEYEQDIDLTMSTMSEFGIKVLRTWAFADVNATLNVVNQTYYQMWVNETGYVNVNPENGFPKLDMVVKAAEKYDVKLIMTLTNNWEDYGGMDFYTSQILGPGRNHSDFYVQPAIISAYQAYVDFVVNRYANSSAIFAWELTNEARCNGYPSLASPNCTVETTNKWIADQSAYIKSIDPYHMVAIGDEGYYNFTNVTEDTNYVYTGQSGMDFASSLAIETVDFGTFHLYPQSWGFTNISGDGAAYIEQHAWTAADVGKPVVLEEFGVTGEGNKTSIYPLWFDVAKQNGIAGIMPWQWGQCGLDPRESRAGVIAGCSTTDGYTIYPNSTIYGLYREVAAYQNGLSGQA